MDTATGTDPRPGERCGDPYGSVYRQLRGGVLARNGGDCSFCGLSAAVETHHSGLVYPCGSSGVSCCGRRRVEVGDLVGLCSMCHLVATTLRRFCRAGGSVFEFSARFMEVVAQCGTGSGFRGLPRSSAITERRFGHPIGCQHREGSDH